ncbi:hypothetical protein IGB42_00299 [Andreprevotia sp. IGB-42]|uniref:tautomerase family protein n=1 Tax=Andreprevotia sp. IGB-42 TaxID=2497473 RepID=UPI00135BF306|nr:tautomerase family protein [Andreprevotia sp. IGB-42]KAF0815221.1 hypothetical protein IGB42_00299 [Andreprevotia sp. IGB-42]
MPYSRISLLKGKTQDYLRALSDNLHRALVETFEVPENDRFQVIHQLAPEELVFDRNYLCGPRSDDYVLIAITAGRIRNTQHKRAFYRRLTELLQISPGIQPQDVMVVINTTEAEDWSFGNGIATMLPAAD